jgi:hypothetical protein
MIVARSHEMPRLKKVLCALCDAKIVPGISFCTNCEQPTVWASHDERTTWELRQWDEKRTPRLKRTASPVVAEVTPIRSRRASTMSAPLTPHPASVKAGLAKTAPLKATPVKRGVASQTASTTPGVRQPKVSTPKVSAPKKQVGLTKPEPERAPAKSRKPAREAVSPESPVNPPVATIDRAEASSTNRDPAIEQVELLRELLQHVISIEEKLNGNGAGLSRRLRLLKR